MYVYYYAIPRTPRQMGRSRACTFAAVFELTSCSSFNSTALRSRDIPTSVHSYNTYCTVVGREGEEQTAAILVPTRLVDLQASALVSLAPCPRKTDETNLVCIY